MKKRILIIGNFPPPYGGVPNHIDRLTSYLTARGWECHVLAGGKGGYSMDRGRHIYKAGSREKARALCTSLLDFTLFKWHLGGSLWWRLPRFCVRHAIFAEIGKTIIERSRIDIIASYNILSYSPVGSVLAHRFNIPHIASVFGEVYKYPALAANRRFYESVFQYTNLLLSCSAHCAASISQLGIDRQVAVENYGIDLTKFRPDSGESGLREELRRHRKHIVLFVGRIGLEMGADSFLELATSVCQRRKDILFVMAGQRAELSSAAEAAVSQLDGALHLEHNVTGTRLSQLYSISDVVLVPTRQQRTCSSLAAMEAMASAKPVICYAIGGIPELVSHEVDGVLVLPEDIKCMEQNLLKLLADDSLRRAMGQNCLAKARSRFDENEVNRRIEAHLDAVLAKAG